MDTVSSINKESDSSIDELYAAHPIIMRYRPYISVGMGWHSIIDKMCFDIEKLSRLDNADSESLPYVSDIKEKYGSLRVTLFGGLSSNDLNNKIDDIVDKCENLSTRVCEKCSKKGTMTSTGWIQTLCKDHSYEKYQGTLFEFKEK